MDSIDFYKKPEKTVDIPLNYKQLCRFCLEEATRKIDTKCMELFKSLTNVELVCSEELPKSICSLCESQLTSACKFRISLIDMEHCWSEFFRQDYLQFVERLDISEEHIYDEIFLEIETTSDEDTFDRSTTPLINVKSRHQPPSIKYSHEKFKRVVQIDSKECYYDSMKKNRSYNTQSFKNQTQQALYFQSSENLQKLSLERNKFEDLTHRPQFMAEDEAAVRTLVERNHDIVSLSYESVDKCLPEENKLHKQRKTQVAKTKQIKIKCVVVGDAAVGKTNLILSYLKNEFIGQHIPTASDIYQFEVSVNKRNVQVVLYDTAGQDSLDYLRQLSYPDCHVFLICFSVVNPQSFTAVRSKWTPTFRNTNASIVLVGTQSDLRSDIKVITNLKKNGLCPVSLLDAWDLAKSIDAEYIETSSQNNVGVKIAFDTAIEYALRAIQTKDSKKSSFWKKIMCWG